MTQRPDKVQVIDEVWDEDRLRGFLDRRPPGDGTDADFFVLLAAYQGMRPGDFRRFLPLFTAAGRDLDARDRRGRTLADLVARHRHGHPFLEALLAAGARAPASRPEPQET
jgi:hypothetical protein